ncbi:hypothetical protein TRAPUB_8984 [Trametes pubescens]|uniref:Cobalamin-independent methionine synthase MetE C-terminal/archaeal domain-containing protein n=1 Tax=Trametes pubescens TaxID=154538 RepID=A0A1M2W3N0_TRAPU|nr:hypothetical protein TRAPUB_8984 [Trametes pubescens]
MFYDGMFDCLDGFKEKLKWTKPLYGEAFDFLKKLAGPENVAKLKVTLGAPEWYHFRHGKYTYEATAYASDDDYFADLIQIYRDEFRDLYARGCRHVQIDDPILVSFCDEKLRQLMLQEGVDPEALLDTYIRVLNGCIADKPSDLLASVHICRGNVRPDRQPFIWGPYNRIARKLFMDLNFERYYLEYDTEWAGTFEPLHYLPRNKHVVLGLVTTKSPELEDLVALRGRIMDAAEVIAHGEVPRPVEEALDQYVEMPHGHVLLKL